MSKVKIEGNASGTGTLTISAPNTDTDRSITLPDGAGEILTDASTLSSSNLSGALPAIDGSALTGVGGLTDAQLWRLSTDRSHNDGEIIGINSGEWEAYDDGNYGELGSSMSVSGTSSESTGGQFTFPSTGIWLVQFTGFCRIFTSEGYVGVRIQSTHNDGTDWDSATVALSSPYYFGYYHQPIATFIFDCTNTSTHRIRFQAREGGGYVTYYGSTNDGQTTALFMKLGET